VTPDESERIQRAAAAAADDEERPARRPREHGSNPFDDLEVPSWVRRDR
jgi:hypothetical protein